MILTKQKGIGLIEVMATLLIVSVGMLGIASLQATGIQAGQGASLQTSALLVVEDIANRMRSNKKGVYDIDTAISSYDSAISDTGTDNGCNDQLGGAVAVVCTPAQMASHDIFLWKTSMANLLPTATGEITSAVIAPAINGLVNVNVTVTWEEKGDTKQYESEFRVVTQ